MKTTHGGILIIATALFASAFQAPAIEGLKVLVQGSNAIVSWPSQTGATYIVQYRPTLNTNDVWTTLTNNLPAATGTNWTSFVHSNSVQYPEGGGGGSGTNGFPAPPGFDGMSAQSTTDISSLSAEEIAALKEQRRQEALAALAYMMEILSNTVAQAEANRQAWIAAGRPARVQETTQTMSTEEMDTSQTVTNTGFYRVVRTGIHFVGVTNGTVLSGRIILPIEVGCNAGSFLDDVYACAGTNTDDSVPIAGLDISILETGLIQATWDTTQTTNGTYLINLGAQIGDSWLSNSPPITLIVSNQIWFPDSFNVAGWYIEVQAQTVNRNGTAHVDVYDDTDYNFLSYNFPTDSEGYVTYDGIRGFRLENFDENYEQYLSKYYNVVVSFSQGGGFAPESTATSTNFIWVESAWPSNTADNLYTVFSIAYQPLYGDPANGGLSAVLLQSMIQDWYSAVEFARDGGIMEYYGVIRGNDQNPFELWSQLDFTHLLGDLHFEEVRNLYYFGHGAPNSIGQSKINPPRYLSLSDLNLALRNFPRNPQYRDHPYRFVFMDGCNTANGDLPKVFGIPKEKNMSASRFTNKGLRFRAYMGWNKYIIKDWVGAPNENHMYFDGHLITGWVQGLSLSNAVNYAFTNANYSAHKKELVIYGYNGLKFDDTIP